MTGPFLLDLVALVPGTDDEQALHGLLSRHQSLGTRPFRARYLKHPTHDPGCFLHPESVLQPFVRTAAHALVVFDLEGSGQEKRLASDVESDVRGRLASCGWNDRVEVIVLRPELEVWVWSDSPNVDEALGWQGREPALRAWLKEKGFWQGGAPKPGRPKETMEAALREAGIQRSAAIYHELATRVSLDQCQDDSFARLRSVLQAWFPMQPQESRHGSN